MEPSEWAGSPNEAAAGASTGHNGLGGARNEEENPGGQGDGAYDADEYGAYDEDAAELHEAGGDPGRSLLQRIGGGPILDEDQQWVVQYDDESASWEEVAAGAEDEDGGFEGDDDGVGDGDPSTDLDDDSYTGDDGDELGDDEKAALFAQMQVSLGEEGEEAGEEEYGGEQQAEEWEQRHDEASGR